MQLEDETFRNTPKLVLHWDGKLPPHALSKWGLGVRIAIVPSGVTFEDIFGITTAKKEQMIKSPKLCLEKLRDSI